MALALPGLRPVQAAGPCDLTAQVAELVAVQKDVSMDEVEQLNAEIAARRKLLNAAIDCDLADIAARRDALGRLPENIRSLAVTGKILEDLAEASRYYEGQKLQIQHFGNWDLKSAARTMALWRKETYLPTVTWADNFLIWADNQQFLEKASERLGQVSRVAFSLKLVNQDEINDLFEKAKASFDVALDENGKAKSALDEKRPLNALIHTQVSLKALADTYQIFFALQEALQKIVK